MNLSRKEIYSEITRQLLDKLSQGTIPWRKSWQVGLPANLQSKKSYNGINFLNLCMNEYASPFYVTYLQCKERGGFINKGEKGSWVIYWEVKQIADTESDDLKNVPFIKRSILFNLAQTSLYDSESEERQIIECEELINNISDRPEIRQNTIRAFYSPVEDYISLPPINSFTSEDEFIATLYHELIHSTGNSSRLNRPLLNTEDSKYSLEELITEIGSAYLCAMSGIAPKTLDNQAAYIKGWLKLAESEDNVFIKASLEAQRAVNFIVNPQIVEKINAA